ncbi:MAG: hypothetical protein ACXACY_26485 [Candidatus Hodarchaeales archaeon]
MFGFGKKSKAEIEAYKRGFAEEKKRLAKIKKVKNIEEAYEKGKRKAQSKTTKLLNLGKGLSKTASKIHKNLPDINVKELEKDFLG